MANPANTRGRGFLGWIEKRPRWEVLTDLSGECDQRTETFAVAAVQRSNPPRRTDLGLVVPSLQLVVGPLGILLEV
jgi:hypothetical protein